MADEQARKPILFLTEKGEIPHQHFDDLDDKHNVMINTILLHDRTRSNINELIAGELASDIKYPESQKALLLRRHLKPLFFLYIWEGDLEKARKYVGRDDDDHRLTDQELRERVAEVMKGESTVTEKATGKWGWMQSCSRCFNIHFNKHITEARMYLKSQSELDEVSPNLFSLFVRKMICF